MIDFSPLRWGEGGESSEPGEGFPPTETRNFGIWVELCNLKSRKVAKGRFCATFSDRRPHEYPPPMAVNLTR